MKQQRFRLVTPIFILLLIFAFVAAPLTDAANAAPHLISSDQQQGSAATLERGYRTGYSDGYQTGYGDASASAARVYRDKDEYKTADRTYTASYGAREDFRTGYQRGYENGYGDGYDRHQFDSSIPNDLLERTQEATTADERDAANVNNNERVQTASSPRRDDDQNGGNNTASSPAGDVIIQSGTEMRVELLTSVSSDASQRGDRIQARVIEPSEYAGAMLDGRITNVKRAGRTRGTAELQLSFEQIRLPDNRWTDLQAQVIAVLDAGGESVGEVDAEGGIKGKDSTKSDVAKVGTGAAIGAIIGAIAGGGKGAAIGAGVGGATGAGGVLVSRGEDVRLPRGTQLQVRAARRTEIR